MKSDEFKAHARFRNGVESLVSTIRRRYNVDKIPVRGKLRTKLFFGFKIAALNFQKLLNYYDGLNLCTLKTETC